MLSFLQAQAEAGGHQDGAVAETGIREDVLEAELDGVGEPVLADVLLEVNERASAVI